MWSWLGMSSDAARSVIFRALKNQVTITDRASGYERRTFMVTADPTGTLSALYIARAHHLPLLIDAVDTETGSRVGGRPPAPLAAAPPRCPVCRGPLEYLLTLAGDTLGERVTRGMAVSLLTCRDLVCRMGSHALVEKSATVLVVHDNAPRAAVAGELHTAFAGRRLIVGPLAADPLREGRVDTDASKIGGLPGFIQNWGDQEASKSRERRGEFLFQWSENTYALAPDMKQGAYPFLCGVVYVFACVDPESKLPMLKDVVAFWQSS